MSAPTSLTAPARRCAAPTSASPATASPSVGNAAPENGDTVVDGAGLVVAPGFIDIHNHSAEGLAGEPGGGVAGRAGHHDAGRRTRTAVRRGRSASIWPSGVAIPPTVNVATFVGHATVRRLVMGDDFKRAARPDEVAKMAALVEQGMREGAFGLSSGLEYEVGGYGETSELVELSKVAARHGGIYMSHIRDEADKSFEALREAIAIGERARIPVQISHIKLGTVGVWHKAAEAIALIESAQKRGVDVTADEYPYNAWSSTITVLVPDKRYDYPPSVEQGARRRRRRGERPDRPPRGASGVRVQDARGGREGPQDDTPVEQFIQIVKDGGAGVVCTSMVDDDMQAFYERPWVMVASDGGIGVRHPRGAGTFPRVLGKYVREDRWLTLPEAIRKMTSAPADRLKLADRGRDRRRRGRRPGAVQPEDRDRPLDVQRSRHPRDRDREGMGRRRAGVGRREGARRSSGSGFESGVERWPALAENHTQSSLVQLYRTVFRHVIAMLYRNCDFAA